MEIDDHKQDHDRILKELDCSQDVARLKVEIALLKEWKRDQKSDDDRMRADRKAEEDKKSRFIMWAGGLMFSIIMAVGASAIQQNATVQVLQEKVSEQKNEISKTEQYISNVIDQMNDALSNHKH